jgi:hypothetical protein
MADHCECAEFEWEGVDYPEEHMGSNDEIDEAREDALAKHRVFFNELGEVV